LSYIQQLGSYPSVKIVIPTVRWGREEELSNGNRPTNCLKNGEVDGWVILVETVGLGLIKPFRSKTYATSSGISTSVWW
jgi:hypothetical protein